MLPRCCGSTERVSEKHWGEVGKKKPGKGSLQDLFLSIAWPSRSFQGWGKVVDTSRVEDEQVFTLAGAKSGVGGLVRDETRGWKKPAVVVVSLGQQGAIREWQS